MSLLTHLSLHKMAAVLAEDNFKCIFLNENDRIPIRIPLQFVPRITIDNRPVLVQVMAWCRIGDKPSIWTNADPIHWRICAALGGRWININTTTSRIFQLNWADTGPMLSESVRCWPMSSVPYVPVSTVAVPRRRLVGHSRLIPMYNARFILWPPSLS